jgi:hypothetical protein
MNVSHDDFVRVCSCTPNRYGFCEASFWMMDTILYYFYMHSSLSQTMLLMRPLSELWVVPLLHKYTIDMYMAGLLMSLAE